MARSLARNAGAGESSADGIGCMDRASHNGLVTNEGDRDQDNGNVSAIAVPLGLVAGVVVGMFVDNLALGLAIGLSAGGAVSALAAGRPRRPGEGPRD